MLHEMVHYKKTIIHILSVGIIVLLSDNSNWPGPEYISMDKLLNHKYQKAYYISSRKQHQNRCNCQQTDGYKRWLCVGLR
jgi:hypothetical protein